MIIASRPMPQNSKKPWLLAPVTAGLVCLQAFWAPAWSETTLIQRLLDASRSIVRIEAENGTIQKAAAHGRLRIRPTKWTRRGAGILIHASGLIATNAHTSNQAARITVFLADNHPYPAKTVFMDTTQDLALLKIEANVTLPALRLADSDQLALRTPVYTIGNSELTKNTLSEGRLTGIGVSRGQSQKIKNPQARLLQVSFNVYPGDSGSPVMNASGDVVGIISAAAQRRGKTAFAVPSNFISRASSGVLSPSPRQ